MIKGKKNIAFINWMLFIVPWLVYTLLTGYLFYKQANAVTGEYFSDINTYISYIRGETVAFAIPYPIMFWIAKFLKNFFSPELSMTMAITLLNSLTMPIL